MSHEAQEGKQISNEIRHHQFGQAHKDLIHEIHSHPHEVSKLINSINHDLKAHHQSPLSIEHDHGKHISHINFAKHDIYHGAHSHKNEQQQAGKPETGDMPLPPRRPDATGLTRGDTTGKSERPALAKPAPEAPATAEKPGVVKPASEAPATKEKPGAVKPAPEAPGTAARPDATDPKPDATNPKPDAAKKPDGKPTPEISLNSVKLTGLREAAHLSPTSPADSARPQDKTDKLAADSETAKSYLEGKQNFSRKDLQGLLASGKMDPAGEPNPEAKKVIAKDRAAVQELEKNWDSPEARSMQSQKPGADSTMSPEKVAAATTEGATLGRSIDDALSKGKFGDAAKNPELKKSIEDAYSRGGMGEVKNLVKEINDNIPTEGKGIAVTKDGDKIGIHAGEAPPSSMTDAQAKQAGYKADANHLLFKDLAPPQDVDTKPLDEKNRQLDASDTAAALAKTPWAATGKFDDDAKNAIKGAIERHGSDIGEFNKSLNDAIAATKTTDFRMKLTYDQNIPDHLHGNFGFHKSAETVNSKDGTTLPGGFDQTGTTARGL